MSDPRALTELIEDAVDKGASTVEEIHKRIAETPLSVLERIGLAERTTRDVQGIQNESIGAVYELIRDVNHSVGRLARELLAEREPDRDA